MPAISSRSLFTHHSWLWICLIALIGVGFVSAPNSYAMQFQVSKSSDSDDGMCDSDCSLREAIAAANANPGPDTIILSDSSYSLSLGPNTGLLISDELTITGVQSSTTIIDAQNSGRIFSIDEGVKVRLEDLTLRNGSSTGNGGAILSWGDLWLKNLIIEANGASYGGAIYSADGSLSIEDSLLRANQASNNGGAIAVSEAGLTVSASLFSANQANLNGGAIALKDSGVTLDQLTLNTNQAGEAGGAIYLQNSSLTLSNSSFDGNTSLLDGGALASIESSLTLSNSSFTKNNSQNNGGALALNEVSHGTLSQLNLVGNQANNNGGAIFHDLASSFQITFSNLQTNHAAAGGAIYNLGQLELGESSVVSNSATLAGGGLHDASNADSTIRNTTFSANQSAANGGGITKLGSGSLSIVHTTIANNSAQVESGGISHTAGSLTISHTLIAENKAATGKDCVGTLASAGFNLIETSAGCTLANPQSSDLLDQAAQLEALGDNGGLTLSHGLQASSPALDSGSAVSSECAAIDQRGVQRPQGSRCDIGALEQLQALALQISFSPQSIKVGEESSLRYSVTNRSDQAFNNIGFISSLSKGLQLEQSDLLENSCGTVQILSEKIRLSQTKLQQGASCSFSIRIKVQEAGNYSASSSTIEASALLQSVAQSSTLNVLNPKPSLTTALFDQSTGLLIIRGEHFLKTSSIGLKQGENNLTLSEPLSVRYINASELHVTLAPELHTSITDALVIVRNPEPGGGESGPVAIQALSQDPAHRLYLPLIIQ